MRLADEYDAGQERGAVQTRGGDRVSNVPVGNNGHTAADIGLSDNQIHEPRMICNAEQKDPGVVVRVIDECVDERPEPTRDGRACAPTP